MDDYYFISVGAKHIYQGQIKENVEPIKKVTKHKLMPETKSKFERHIDTLEGGNREANKFLKR